MEIVKHINSNIFQFFSQGDVIKEEFLYTHSNSIKSPCTGRLRLNSNSYHLVLTEPCQGFTEIKHVIGMTLKCNTI